MAKGLRSSALKANKAKAKKNVFGPVEAARNERLSAKLLELAQQSKPERNEMDIETAEATANEEAISNHVDADEEAMDVDGVIKQKPRSKSALKKQRSGKIQKKVRKPRNVIAFPKRGSGSGGGDKLAKSKKRRL